MEIFYGNEFLSCECVVVKYSCNTPTQWVIILLGSEVHYIESKLWTGIQEICRSPSWRGKAHRGVAEEGQNNEEAKAEYDYMIRFDSKVYINK